MEIEVELFGQLAPGREGKKNLQVDSACTAGEVAKLLDLDTRLIGLVTIDGVQKKLDDPVPSGSRLCFFPPMSGG